MVKKVVKSDSHETDQSVDHKAFEKAYTGMSAQQREELLIENFVGLQHAMTNLSIKFGQLSDNISRLLMVFEESAKNYMEGGKSNDADMLKKINSLLEQNKTIAKGLVLMEEGLRERSASHHMVSEQESQANEPTFRPRPLPSI